MKKTALLSTIFFAFFVSSCGNSNDNAEPAASDTLAVDSLAMIEPDEPQDYISIPAPDEMFSFMKSLGSTGKSTAHLSDPDNYKKLADTKSKALNFGVYATDFLYCSTFDYGVEALKYFVSVKKLGDELGISGVINESTGNRIEKNIGKTDSLTGISNALYFSAIAELEKSDKANVLSLVIAGGWIESLHLVTTMATKFKAGDPVIDRIAEQKYALDNLLGYLDKYSSDENVVEISRQLAGLKIIFDQLKEESVSGVVSSKGTKKVLPGGTKITITEQQYAAIAAKIKDIRESFVMTK
jgi:hypothetical protein